MFFSRLFRFLKKYGLMTFLKKIIEEVKVFFQKRRNTKLHTKILKDILNENSGKEIIVFLSPIPWNVPLFQRPQHIAQNLARQGYLYFYCTDSVEVNGFKKIENSCYVTNRQDIVLKNIEKFILHTYSTDTRNLKKIIKLAKNRKCTFLYEYIDELDEELVGKINNYTIKKHKNFLKDEENTIVVASADTLYREVLSYRTKKIELVTNGVDYSHFNIPYSHNNIPIEIKDVVNKKKPIIGYFGAFASWFDYELIIKLAINKPEYEILLIGWNYDNSILNYGFENFENVTIIGPIDYQFLPEYAVHFSISTIPFVLNQITESTSPIKLFEYMALGKPIVTTNLKECRKYKSVLIAENHDDFINKLDIALKLSTDKDYQNILAKEALENTWEAKAKAIQYLLHATV
ncbi:glycosyltransferase [Ureibacillus thermosphaericus]|jgi:teichuronic acid biosynthesis glycosyltransferase TuaH|uniref:Glycosyltransferase family 1 protein n=1 Tax=Ureibacillus thermosphaericus TaxID=51173 RepID=A0A840PYT8_URETH|nr:glycosyltransferase [Ureibacillus thermosphaericus]MBB5150474.1 hypothetical protein [Ureibacillus thermosphaericus]NKZ33095.1 glycosyltransferase family 1 protein [Ureibacillus thermosphaericus]